MNEHMIATLASLALLLSPGQTELTIYNQGFGVVKELRQLKLKEGVQTIEVTDVASMIDPTSVGFRSITDAHSFTVLEQNYQYDLINPQAILNKSVGQKIRFIRTLGNMKDVLEGTLLSAPTSVVARPEGGSESTYNGMVIRTDDNRIVLDPTGEVEVNTVPAGLISRPTLLWSVDSAKAGENSVELSYITQGLSWNADYVVTIDGLGKGDLQGWVTVNNQSGATWENAKLKLLAGDVNTVRATRPEATFGLHRDRTLNGVNRLKEEMLFEYHLYTLERPATVANKQTKQLSLLEGHDIPIRKKLIVDSIAGRYYPGEGEIGTGDVKPQVRLEFVNDKESGLGMPLPKGKMRIYQRDKSGSVQLLGEDQIDHTPRNEKVSVVVGRSFDVVSTRKRTKFTRLSDQSVSESFSIELRNRKEEAETVNVLERHYGDWTVQSHSQEFKKLDSESMEFVVILKPNEVKTVRYTVETRW